MKSLAFLAASLLAIAACGGSSAQPAEPTEPAPAVPSDAPAEPTSETPADTTAAMTPDQCTTDGGQVRGDIGDGKIACADGERELGRVAQGIEGAICCAPATP